MVYLEKPYYYVYEIIIYWKNSNTEIKSFYKIGLIKVEREDRQLNFRYRREIDIGCKVFVVNQIRKDNYYDALNLENNLIKLSFEENLNDFSNPKYSYKRKSQFIGDLKEFPIYFSGSTEAFRTPKRLTQLVDKIKSFFDKNQSVYYPKNYNTYLSDKNNNQKK